VELQPRRLAALPALGLLLVAATAAADGTPPLPATVPPDARARVAAITDQPSLATRVAGEPFVARRELFEYLLDHPEFATHVTRTLKLARYRIWRTAEGLAIDDGWGTTGTFETVWAANGARLMLARGEYRPRLLPNIRGQAVVLIDYGVRPAPNGGGSLIDAGVTGYVKLDSRFLGAVSRLAGGLARAKAEKEATRLVRLFARTTHAIEADPAAVYERLRQSPDTPARELDGFRLLLGLPGTP
jgi:hypothetical protein